MSGYTTEQIRNVALISHGGAGKTSLAEAMLYVTKTTNRLGTIEAGNTVTDYDDEEIRKQFTINSVPAPFTWREHKINILDTPGYFDFIGDVLGAMRAAESALITVCAVSGVEVGTEKVWDYAGENRLTRMFFINKLDRENADFDLVMSRLRDLYGSTVIPLTIPWGKETSFKGVVDLINQKALTFSADGREVKSEDIPAELQDAVADSREQLIESVAEADDELLMKYLEGEPLTEEEIKSGLRVGVRDGKIVPVLCGSATNCKGIQVILDVFIDYLPSPADREAVKGVKPGTTEEVLRKSAVDEPFSAVVFKTMADPFVGRINYFKVISGVFKPDSQAFNPNKDKSERIGPVFFMRGKTQLSANEIIAGDIGAVAKLQLTATGDTICDKNNPVQYLPIEFPDPVISFAVEPRSKGDEEKVMSGLSRFLDEDPTFFLERKAETRQTIISGLGEMQLENIVSKLRLKFGVEVELSTPRVPYKETIKGRTKVEGKHKKQSGGRGQYGHVFLEIEALSGEEYSFEDKIFGGVVPKQYIPAVEKGVKEAMEQGVLAGYQVVGVGIKLVDGSYHNVDSSEMAFKIAGSIAFKKGVEQCKPVLLEPIMDVEVLVSDEYMGDIMGDLNSRRGRIQGMEPAGALQKIKAQVPMAEMFRYAIDLRSMTQGRGFFTMKFASYEEVPALASEKVIAQAKEEKEKE